MGYGMKGSRNLQSNIIRVQQALHSSKFSCFLCFTLDRNSETASLSKKPLTIVGERGQGEICHMSEDACARDVDTVRQRFHLIPFISSLTANERANPPLPSI